LIDIVAEAKAGSSPLPVRLLWLPGIEDSHGYKKKDIVKPSRAVVNSGSEVERLDPPKKTEFRKIGSTVLWAGVENNYFASIFIPVQASDAYMNGVKEGSKDVHNVIFTMAQLKPEPYRLRMFIGPKDFLILKEIGMELENVVDFGFFGPITKALFFALRSFHKYTNNWGLAIVLLTIVIKIVFVPFMQKSFASQKKLQTMQPELKKIQEKYGKMKNDDPRKQNMNAEIMQLHKRHGVNPLGGCLPMLVQMPVLFAFYSLLSNAIELRHAPFAFWIQDLSRPDPLYITPIIMGGTMLLQQKMTPISDPMQQRMMYIMPIMFTYISLNLQSGLVLYWLLSNVLGIAHQWYFMQQQKKSAVAPTDKEGNA
jgi:YidC/Oxa1 family membrane protein insertase